jgi:hypothetical protein
MRWEPSIGTFEKEMNIWEDFYTIFRSQKAKKKNGAVGTTITPL